MSCFKPETSYHRLWSSVTSFTCRDNDHSQIHLLIRKALTALTASVLWRIASIMFQFCSPQCPWSRTSSISGPGSCTRTEHTCQKEESEQGAERTEGTSDNTRAKKYTSTTNHVAKIINSDAIPANEATKPPANSIASIVPERKEAEGRHVEKTA